MTDKQHATAALLEDSTLLKKGRADVFAQRERTKRKRLLRAIVMIGVLDVYLFTRFVNGNGFQLPSLPQDWVILAFPLLILIPVLLMVAMPLMNGKSPHASPSRGARIAVGHRRLSSGRALDRRSHARLFRPERPALT